MGHGHRRYFYRPDRADRERVLDEYTLTHHYLYWREDIDRAADLGVRAMRYGIPWYKVEPAPGVFDWEWVDRVLEYIAGKGIAVIADLVHYGTPLWMRKPVPQLFLSAACCSVCRRVRQALPPHSVALHAPQRTLDHTCLHGNTRHMAALLAW